LNLPAYLSFFIILLLLVIPIILSILDILVLDNMVIVGMIIFWIVMLSLDISFTIKNKKFLRYESSFVFSFFYKKIQLQYAVPLTILCEVMIVVSSPFVFIHSWNIQIISIVSVIVGVIHIDGFYKTRKFIIAHNI